MKLLRNRASCIMVNKMFCFYQKFIPTPKFYLLFYTNNFENRLINFVKFKPILLKCDICLTKIGELTQ